VAFERMAKLLSSRATLRNVAGILLLAFGLWTAGNALWHGAHPAGHGQATQAPDHGEHAGHPH
jgi:hypothetical protein